MSVLVTSTELYLQDNLPLCVRILKGNFLVATSENLEGQPLGLGRYETSMSETLFIIKLSSASSAELIQRMKDSL